MLGLSLQRSRGSSSTRRTAQARAFGVVDRDQQAVLAVADQRGRAPGSRPPPPAGHGPRPGSPHCPAARSARGTRRRRRPDRAARRRPPAQEPHALGHAQAPQRPCPSASASSGPAPAIHSQASGSWTRALQGDVVGLGLVQPAHGQQQGRILGRVQAARGSTAGPRPAAGEVGDVAHAIRPASPGRRSTRRCPRCWPPGVEAAVVFQVCSSRPAARPAPTARPACAARPGSSRPRPPARLPRAPWPTRGG
jgi:hypothetical protein